MIRPPLRLSDSDKDALIGEQAALIGQPARRIKEPGT
jgi:hypothetical protein